MTQTCILKLWSNFVKMFVARLADIRRPPAICIDSCQIHPHSLRTPKTRRSLFCVENPLFYQVLRGAIATDYSRPTLLEHTLSYARMYACQPLIPVKYTCDRKYSKYTPFTLASPSNTPCSFSQTRHLPEAPRQYFQTV